MQHILLIEDSSEFQKLIRRVLGVQTCKLTCASSAAEGQKELERNDVDLIILDLKLPDRDGFDLCVAFQENPKTAQIPVIVLTGKANVADKVTAFTLGVEDYIVKPFDVLEFRARVEAKLKRLRLKKENEEVLYIGKLQVHTALYKVFTMQGEERRDLNLSPTEFKLFFHLARNQGRVFSRDQLIGAVWGDNADVYERTVDVHICSLRRKLAEMSHWVESVPGLGYRFVVAETESNGKINAA
ncbi:MAG: response regulator transcription factor [Parcubacteria group bacterium]|nr:response regulator transcription factor [Parcubacteria group bacterium]